MGVCKVLSGGSTTEYKIISTPDPFKFKIIDTIDISPFVVATIKYENCTNFNGYKICVFKCSSKELYQCESIDPHFIRYSEPMLIARFMPTNVGLEMAKKFCKTA